MADIQTLQYQMSPGNGIIKRYQTDVNKKTGSYITYDITNIGQKDALFKSEPTLDSNGKPGYTISVVDSYKTEYDKLSDTDKRFLSIEVGSQANNQRAAYVNKNFTQDQINNLFPGMPRVANTAPPAPNVTSGGTTIPATEDETPTDITLVSLPEQINSAKSGLKTFGPLIYPEKITENGQDYIKFEIFQYISQKLSDNNLLFEQRSSYTNPIGTIVLPIQPTINDTNTVTWNDSKMGILEMMGANIALGAMNSTGTDYMTNMAEKFAETIKGAKGEPVSPAVVSAVQNYIAKMAVNSNTNLLSRTGGAITNPNLNLLFESPDLRNFTFNFKLTPRTEKEGTIVRRIIRKFKEHMAAQKSVGNLFLETPDIFNIKYIRGKDIKNTEDNKTHKSLNLFKTCALRSFGVNYTPSGTYMTYNDTAGTMSSYDLTMAFTELEPVYWNDYNDEQNPIADDQIGY